MASSTTKVRDLGYDEAGNYDPTALLEDYIFPSHATGKGSIVETLPDEAVVYAVNRSPERRVFNVDVGAIPHEHLEKYLDSIQDEIRQKKVPERKQLEIEREVVTSVSRKLDWEWAPGDALHNRVASKVEDSWSLELSQDLHASHGLDLETEITKILSDEILKEIDAEIVASMSALAAGANGTFEQSFVWNPPAGTERGKIEPKQVSPSVTIGYNLKHVQANAPGRLPDGFFPGSYGEVEL